MHQQMDTSACLARGHGRRSVLKAALALALALPWAGGRRTSAEDARVLRPRANDRLVFALGEREGQVISPDALVVGGGPVLAYPKDSASGVVRSGSRLNQVIVLRLDPADISEETRPFAAEGVVAYSAVCTHLGCTLSGWLEEERLIKCFCHESMFDPKNYGKVVGGPAPRRLAILPLRINGGEVICLGDFKGRVGFQPA